ncbi:MAG: DinB family protein [Rhodobacteraceae bacterium]|nr:DinB family protein [Paracoccaceae bacterium]
MISIAYCRVFARYNHWQNHSLIAAADGLTPKERWMDRGAFFKSIAATFNHMYWADALMLERLRGNEAPHRTIAHSLSEPDDWEDLKGLRAARDADIAGWAASVTDAGLAQEVGWYPPDGSEKITMPVARCAVQMFNHQTHHRGQIHAMLTAAGAAPQATDLSAMPEDLQT